MSEGEIPLRETWNPIDEALYSPADLYRVDEKEAERLKLQATQFSINYHYAHNRFYRKLCEQRAFTPQDVDTLEDLTKVPLIPDSTFKQYPEPEKLVAWLRGISSDDIKYPTIKGSTYTEIIEGLNNHGFKLIFSSGSSGRSSFIPRGDKITLTRELHFRKHFSRLWGLKPEACSLYLGADYRKASLNWIFSHALMHDIRGSPPDKIYFAADFKVTPETVQNIMGLAKGKTQLSKLESEKVDAKRIKMIEDLSKEEASGQIHTPPYLIDRLLSKMEESGKTLNLGDRWSILMGGGGWFGLPQQDLWKKVERVLGIPNRNCRDLYACTETVLAFPSCEGHCYHLPSTLIHPFALNSDLEPVGFGEYGRFGFIETIAHAYPAFVITGDRVKLLESCPSCNRTGPVIDYPVTRMSGVEDKGCAAMLKKLMSEEAGI